MTEQQCPKCASKLGEEGFACGSANLLESMDTGFVRFVQSETCRTLEAAYNRGVQDERARSILEKARFHEPLKPTFFTVTPTQFDWIKDQTKELEND